MNTITKSLTVFLTEDMPAAQKQADDDIKAIENAALVIRHSVPEAYFHRLRRRVAETPELADKIAVFYTNADGKTFPIGLQFEDQLRWPVGFYTQLWDEEVEIEKIRRTRKHG